MFLYTALGDSITAGESATSPQRAYPAQIVAMMHNTVRGEWISNQVLAEPGWTSRSLTTAVFDNPAAPLMASQAVSIWVGGDNLIHAGLAVLGGARKTVVERALVQYGKDLGILVSYVHRVSKASVVICTQYNPFPASPLAAEAIHALNQATVAAASQTHAAIARPDVWFAGREHQLIAGYTTGRIEDALSGRPAVHPNNDGHKVIAANLLPMIRAGGNL
jgi:acyl-CoA thioesterase I